MLRLERIFKNKTFLATISLGALGNLLEFEIHNQMHMRWSSTLITTESLDSLHGEIHLILIVYGVIRNMTTWGISILLM